MQKIVQNVMDSGIGEPIANVEKSRKGECRDDHHDRCPVNLLLTGPSDTLHLDFDFLEIVTQPLPRATLNYEFVCHILIGLTLN
jgi:hypothetical protein